MNHDRPQKIAVLIPCLNEAKGIPKVMAKLPHRRLNRNLFNIQVIVIDNNSTDNTAKVAREAGATVIKEPNLGKGNAVRTGFKSVPSDADYVVMLDGDDTYDAGEIPRLVEPLRSDYCDVIIGSRLSGKISGDSMTTFNRFSNWLFTHMVRFIYRGANVTDVLTGFFAWKKPVLDQLAPTLVAKDFAIEMEMITKMARMGFAVYSVPISYTNRKGDSNLRPLKDGTRILKMFLRNLSWHPKQSSFERRKAGQKKLA